ncbi:focadhesin-like isoform X2 [Dysidea avara]|uniref:focadhesin-like isoform X2 n=1 Tax=Dysidea avara TaxID=196820 RepID=UPI00331C0C9B
MAGHVKTIEFDSQVHQKQTSAHVIRSIELEFRKTQTVLDLKVPLIQSIYDKLSHSSGTVVQCCCHILLTGAEQRWIHLTGLLNGLLNVMPSTSHAGVLLKCLGDLLFTELKTALKANSGIYQSPYSISYREKPHPFISVTTSSPQLWPRLLLLTKQMLQHPPMGCEPHVVNMLRPFIKYCLLVPTEDGLPVSMATRTFSMLVGVIHYHTPAGNDSIKVGQDILSLLIALLPCYETKSSEQLMDTTNRVEELVYCLVKMAPCCQQNDPADMLCDILQSITCEVVIEQEQVVLLSLLKSVSLLTATYKTLLNCPHRILWLCWMLLCGVGHLEHTTILLTQVQYLVKSGLAQTLQPLVLPLTVVHATGGSLRQLAGDLLTNLLTNLSRQQSIDEANSTINQTGSTPLIPNSTSEFYSELCATAELFCQLSRCPAQKLAWLDSLQEQLDLPELHISGDMRRLLLVVLTGLYLQQQTSAQMCVLEVISKLVKQTPTICPEMLVFVQYILSQKCNRGPEVSLRLLNLLPDLAAHKVMLPLVVRVIHSLSRRVSLYPIIIRLLCKMWRERDGVFAHLHKLLLAPPPQHTPPEICREIVIAKVTSIHDICQYKPELHGEEIIGLVLQCVVDFSLQNPSVSAGKDDGVMAMVIRSLYLLCYSEIVDLPVAWNMVAPKLRGERRPKVLAVMCDLFSLLPLLDMDESLQPLCDHALTFLWSCAASTVGAVVEASFKALCHFELEDFKLTFLPNKLLSLLDCTEVVAIAQDDTMTLNGQQCVQLSAGICTEGLDGYSQFLSHIIAIEIEQGLRGVAHLTQKHFPQLERFLRDSSHKLSRFVSDKEKDIISTTDFCYIGGVLMATQLAEPEQNSRGYQQQLGSVVKHYKMLWSCCLMTDVSLSSVWLHQLFSLPSSWAVFIHRLFAVSVKLRSLETCPPNMRDSKAGYQQKQWEAECWTRCKLVEQVQSCGNNARPCSVMLSLCGLAMTCCTMTDTFGSVEGSLAWLRDWSDHAFLTSLLSMLVRITGEGKPPKDSSGEDIFSFINDCIQQATDLTTIKCMAAVAAAEVVRHVFSLAILPADIKDAIVSIATNLFKHLTTFNQTSIIISYSLSKILLASHHQLPKMSPIISDIVQLCSVQLDSSKLLNMCVVGGFLPVLCGAGGGAHSVAQRLHKELVAGLALSRFDPNTILFQAACLAIGSATPVMCNAGILSPEDCGACVKILQDLAQNPKLLKCYVIHVCLGGLLYGLASGCIPHAHQSLSDVTSQWVAVTQSQQHNNMVIASLYVLVGSARCCDLLSSHLPTGALLQSHLQVIVSSCSPVLLSGLAHGQTQTELSHVLWMITRLRQRTQKATTVSGQNLPKSYAYLPEGRALPAVFELLSTVSGSQSGLVVSALLTTLTQCSSLPPVDWTGALLSITRRMPRLCQTCVQCALKLTETSKGFHMFIIFCCDLVFFSSLETSTQQLIMSKLHLVIADVATSSLATLLGSCCLLCQRKKELLSFLVEGILQCVKLKDLPDTSIDLLHHVIWQICELLQPPATLNYITQHHLETVANITTCLLSISDGDAHTTSVRLQEHFPCPVLNSLIYCQLIRAPSNIPHNFLHSCLATMPPFTSMGHYVLMGLLKGVKSSVSHINKQERFHVFTHCIQESARATYQPEAEAQLALGISLLSCSSGKNTLDLWLGFLGQPKMMQAEPALVYSHLCQIISLLLPCIATSKESPAGIKQLLSQWMVEATANRNVGNQNIFGNRTTLVTMGGSGLWIVWANLL